MVVRIRTENDLHDNFYEGTHVGFHWESVEQDGKQMLDVVVEGRKDSVTIEVEKGSNTGIFLMNDSGKTIESRYL